MLIDEAHHMMPPDRETANSLPLQAHGTVFITVHPSDVAKGALETANLIVILGGAPAATLSLFCDAVGELPPELGNRQVDAGFAYIWDRRRRRLHHARIIGPRQQLQRHKRKYTEGELAPDRSFTSADQKIP